MKSKDRDNLARKEAFMRRAIAVAARGMAGGHGGPFGAVIVKDGEIVAEGHNRVLSSKDPTAHAEVTAIRAASRKLDSFDLSGCEVYVNGLPCPMCMAAIYWARLDKLYYACLPEDAAAIGFDDQAFYEELEKPVDQRALPIERVEGCYEEARACYQSWLKRTDRVPY